MSALRLDFQTVLSIRSIASNRELAIGKGRDGYLVVELTGHRVTAVTEVWVEVDAPGLVHFLAELGHLEQPWVGERTWSSIERDLDLSVSCTALGAVTFRVRIAGLSGAPEAWEVAVGIETEFGQLQRIGRDAMELLDARRP